LSTRGGRRRWFSGVSTALVEHGTGGADGPGGGCLQPAVHGWNRGRR
jgi:hypothetical protein